MCCFLFKQTTAYEMRISDWSSDVCSSDLDEELLDTFHVPRAMLPEIRSSSEVYGHAQDTLWGVPVAAALGDQQAALIGQGCLSPGQAKCTYGTGNFLLLNTGERSEEHTSELQSLMRISYAVFCLTKKKTS